MRINTTTIVDSSGVASSKLCLCAREKAMDLGHSVDSGTFSWFTSLVTLWSILFEGTPLGGGSNSPSPTKDSPTICGQAWL